MIASLMMYTRPELETAHNRFWSLIRTHLAQAGIDSPETLSQTDEEMSVWTNPNLTLSQTCGMPYRLWLHDKVQLVGTPDYGLPDCPAGYYRSPLIVRVDDSRTDLSEFKDARFAYNQTFSQSGYAAPFWHAAQHGFWFENELHTGQHILSAKSVAEGTADIAALDAVTWRNIQRFEPFAKNLRVLDWTTPTAGLPLITALGNDADAIHDAVQSAIKDLSGNDRADLGIRSLVRIPKDVYLAVPNPPGT